MKKLTLDESWELCLEMWKWIADNYVKGGFGVGRLKTRWLVDHGFERSDIHLDCFFCEYMDQNRNKPTGNPSYNCDHCPAVLVERSFQCTKCEYHYICKPVKFYQKLVELNRIRLSK